MTITTFIYQGTSILTRLFVERVFTTLERIEMVEYKWCGIEDETPYHVSANVWTPTTTTLKYFNTSAKLESAIVKCEV